MQKSKDFYRLVSNTAITTATLKTLAIKRMLQYLKPGGKLFTMHSPIWSAFDGHHLPIGIPERSLTSKIDLIALSPKSSYFLVPGAAKPNPVGWAGPTGSNQVSALTWDRISTQGSPLRNSSSARSRNGTNTCWSAALLLFPSRSQITWGGGPCASSHSVIQGQDLLAAQARRTGSGCV